MLYNIFLENGCLVKSSGVTISIIVQLAMKKARTVTITALAEKPSTY
jgi:hypothetical protein